MSACCVHYGVFVARELRFWVVAVINFVILPLAVPWRSLPRNAPRSRGSSVHSKLREGKHQQPTVASAEASIFRSLSLSRRIVLADDAAFSTPVTDDHRVVVTPECTDAFLVVYIPAAVADDVAPGLEQVRCLFCVNGHNSCPHARTQVVRDTAAEVTGVEVSAVRLYPAIS
jgi:hypothetical protein